VLGLFSRGARVILDSCYGSGSWVGCPDFGFWGAWLLGGETRRASCRGF